MQLTKYTKYKPLTYDKAWDLLVSDVPDSDSEVNLNAYIEVERGKSIYLRDCFVYFGKARQ